ncbi:MarR family winged helix-turn-helix transcriptional regulator [Loktanella salsilacus]|uniref:MarR family winged helix-turn-helix transcriptional regulator n=1 Tax=Loktanella salsilacus TaxID=195913 RepID=UPI003734FEC0
MPSKPHRFHGILHSARLLEQVLEDRLAPTGVSPRQAHVLTAINELEPVSQSCLAEAFEVKQASMSTMIDRLLAADFISRAPDPLERRRNVIGLTDKGRSKLDAIHKIWSEMDEHIQTLLGAADADSYFRLSAELRGALGGHPPGQRPRPVA